MCLEEVFECQMCGHCCQGCGGIVINSPEQERIASFLHISTAELFSQYLEARNSKPCIKTCKDEFCIFFHSDKGCAIHAVKPDVCQAWPFFRGNLMDKLSFELAKEYCPGIKPDSTHKEFLRRGVNYLSKNGLAADPEEGAPNALCVKDLKQWK